MTKISVIIPLYNKENYIKKTILSVLSQDCSDFEIVVVNDGSTDNSLNIVSAINSPRIKLINKQNGGVSSARNRGIIEARGEYVIFLDADDVFLPGALTLLEKTLKKEPHIDMLVCGVRENNAKSSATRERRPEYCLQYEDPFKGLWYQKFYTCTGNCFVRRSKYIEAGKYNEKLSLFEDLECTVRLLPLCHVASIPDPTMQYNREADGLSRHLPSLDKEYGSVAFIRDFNKGYAKLVVADFLMRRILWRYLHKDFKGAMQMLRNNFTSIHVLIYAFISSFFVNHARLTESIRTLFQYKPLKE